jgi:Spy/CpxP family protein refolding chaperone
MKTSRNIVWVASLSLLLTLSASVMAATAGTGKHGDGMAGIVAQLDLTSAQQDKVNAIISDTQVQMKAIRKEAKASGDVDTAKTKMRDARHDEIKKISAVLTADQKTKFHQLLKDAEAAHKAEKAGSATTQPAAQ